jgi:8-oxo-dGTP pyrophosphatase MutT (NUDIX family)
VTAFPQFDPRTVPIVGVDAHLPSVAEHVLQAQAIAHRFTQAPSWTPELRAEPPLYEKTLVPAAVLIALVQGPSGLQVLLTERASKLSTHSGQVAFPGGKVDPQDVSMEAAAMREAHEEVGLEPAFVKVMGTLPQYVTGTAFEVTPVVALVEPGFSLVRNPQEVATVFQVPLAFLMNPAHHRRHAMQWMGQHREWFSMAYADAAGERFIWGATAGMLRNLYRFLSA